MKKKSKNITMDDLAVMVARGFGSVDKRFGEVDKRFDLMEKKIESVKDELKTEINSTRLGMFNLNDNLVDRVKKLEVAVFKK